MKYRTKNGKKKVILLMCSILFIVKHHVIINQLWKESMKAVDSFQTLIYKKKKKKKAIHIKLI